LSNAQTTSASTPPLAGEPAPLTPALIALRVLLIAVGLGLWFWTQGLIGARDIQFDPAVAKGMLSGDGLLKLTEPVNTYLNNNERVADYLLIVSSLLINVLAIYLFARAIFGSSTRPFLGLLILFALRQICQGMSALPAPPEMIWHQPTLGGWEPPGLLVTYKVGNDFFFSGHTAIAVYGAVELARLGRLGYLLLGLMTGLFQIAAVVVLRAHWAVDVYAGIATALLIAYLAQHIAPLFDRQLERLAARLGRSGG